jgi:rubrerythrin
MQDVLKDIALDLQNIGSVEEAVEIGISLEDQGHGFYQERAALTRDAGARQMYEFLAEEEEKHAQYLHDFLDKLSTHVEVSEMPDFSDAFSEEFSGERLEEIGILLAALRFERKSEDFYLELAKKTADPSQKAFFEKIASVERGHYELIDGVLESATQFRMQT